MTMVKNLKLLLWKNFTLKKRKTLITVLEVLTPLLFSSIVIYLRFSSLPRTRPPTNYRAIDISFLPGFFYSFPLSGKLQLIYIPSTSETLKALVGEVEKSFDVEFEVLGYPSESLFETYIIHDPKAFYALAGIVFDHNFKDNKEALPLKVQYKLRLSSVQRNNVFLKLLFQDDDPGGWHTSSLYPLHPPQGPRHYGYSDGGYPGYNKEGFLALQHAIDKAIMWHHAPKAAPSMFKSLRVFVKRFPYGTHLQDDFFLILQNEFPLLLLLSFICFELITINSIVLEKERRLKEYLCIMGLHSWQHWLAWFIMFFTSAFTVVCFMTLLFCFEVRNVAVFKNSNPGLIFVFLLCFAVATIFFAFMISTFFQKAHVATTSGGIIFFFTYLPYLYLTSGYPQRGHSQKIAFCLLSNVAMALGVRLISIFEAQGTGIQWSNMGSVRGEFSFTQVLLMLLLDSVLYSLVAWYADAIFPGDYGTPRPWYFFVTRSYWCGNSSKQLDKGVTPRKSRKSIFFQEEPTNLVKGIEIQQLCKVFPKGDQQCAAVRSLSLNLYEGQITVLLGHNGAGKTTICSMLTGLIPPTSGHAYINGYEISKDMVQIRKTLGWCPQHDVLFDNLTVAEHLAFYAQLKGLSRQECPEEVQDMLCTLGLQDKWDAPSKFLSGGMKRKLSIGIAMVAGSKVLMLDEPTSGVDIISRRAIWDLLQQQKSERTVLLTTHFMDEADLLGDRIAIMAKGALQCCGSSMFLKQKFGAGYYVTLVKTPECDTQDIFHVISRHIPRAIFQASIGEELTFILPKDQMHKFESLFTELENKQKELGITSFGASVTTMEEVFIKVTQLVNASEPPQVIKYPSIHSVSLFNRVPVDKIKRLHSRIFSVWSGLPIKSNVGLKLLQQQFYAMFLKRALYSWRHWMLTLTIQVLVPLLVTVYSLSSLNLREDTDNVPLEMTLKTYGRTIVPFYFAPNSKLGPQLAKQFRDLLVAEDQTPLELQDSVEQFLLKKMVEDPVDFDGKYLVGVSVEDQANRTMVTALFNNQAFHTPALAVALVDSLLFRLLSGPQASITVTNHPQPQSAKESSENILYQGPKGHYLVINLLFGIAVLSSSFSILTVKEKSLRAKHVQFASGVYAATYWLSALLWDLLSFLVPSLLLLVVFLCYKEEAFTRPPNALATGLALMLYAWAIIPFIYLACFCFSNAGSACVKLIITLTFLSIGPFVLVSSERDLGYTETSELWDQIFLPLPGHCLGMALFNLYYNFELRKLCANKNLSQEDCNDLLEGYVMQKNTYAWKSLGIGKYLVALTISGALYLSLLLLLETDMLWRLKARFASSSSNKMLTHPWSTWRVMPHSVVSMPRDQDVNLEARRISACLEMLCEDNPLVLKEVSKVYAQKIPPLAVNKVSFTVSKEECFALLGLNGTGKTSIFKMLTGEETITSGDAFIKGISVRSDLGKTRQWTGYCPQQNALLNHMTGRETLVMFARLRGVPERHIRSCVDQLIDDLLLVAYADKLVKTYSGGNKRKLSAGIALIGEPSVIFLDEPSTGMDPMARRLLWGTVARARKSGKAIVITSHSMEECEALCTRLAIMVQGQFKCLGGPQHVKSKFGSGYALRAKVHCDGQPEALEEFKAFVRLTFPGSILEDEHLGMVQYHLQGEGLSWGKVFGIMEQAKAKYELDDYSISQVSLEDIFLGFLHPPQSRRPTGRGSLVAHRPSQSFRL